VKDGSVDVMAAWKDDGGNGAPSLDIVIIINILNNFQLSRLPSRHTTFSQK
jgi:hypothetical protein